MATEYYQDLWDVIDYPDGFDHSKYYEHEETMIRPALEDLGFTGIRFLMGERDSFGPLTRIVHTDQGKLIYG